MQSARAASAAPCCNTNATIVRICLPPLPKRSGGEPRRGEDVPSLRPPLPTSPRSAAKRMRHLRCDPFARPTRTYPNPGRTVTVLALPSPGSWGVPIVRDMWRAPRVALRTTPAGTILSRAESKRCGGWIVLDTVVLSHNLCRCRKAARRESFGERRANARVHTRGERLFLLTQALPATFPRSPRLSAEPAFTCRLRWRARLGTRPSPRPTR